MATGTQTKSVHLITDRSDRVLIIEGEDYEYNRAGRAVSKVEPTKLAFRDYRCEVSLYDGPLDKHQGKAVVHGVVQGMDYDELIAIIEGHPLFGLYFWREGEGPQEQRPTLAELEERVASATHAELRELLDAERGSHNRREALAMIGDAALRAEEAGAEGVSDSAGGAD